MLSNPMAYGFAGLMILLCGHFYLWFKIESRLKDRHPAQWHQLGSPTFLDGSATATLAPIEIGMIDNPVGKSKSIAPTVEGPRRRATLLDPVLTRRRGSP